MPEDAGMERARLAAAQHGASLVKDGMSVGLGSGRAAAAAIRCLGERIRSEKLEIRGVPTSYVSQRLAEEAGVPLMTPGGVISLDLTLDGADEVDRSLNVIKGAGGALVREKLIARLSQRLALMVESSKQTPRLGGHLLPVAVIPYAWESTASRLLKHCRAAALRKHGKKPYVTDDGLYILDLDTGAIRNPRSLEQQLKTITGVVEVGLFIDLCHELIVGQPDGSVIVRTRVKRTGVD